MAYHILIALLPLLLFVTTIAVKDVDFNSLVLMWPGSYCKQTSDGCCLPKTGEPQLDFFVSGLFPYSKDGTALTQCKKSRFYINELADLTDDLHSYWPSIECPRSDGHSMWRNTWKTYGVCTGLSEHDYFKKALDLRAKIDMLSIFKRNGIISTDEADYSISDVLKAITNGIGANAAIQCSKNAWDESIIYKIYMCVDKEATKIVQCPVLPTFTCAERVVFGSFTYDMLSNVTNVATNPIKMRVFNQ
ncbi:extracellular ribonuclease LE-like [Magnolia sinica]|uniref:extracellular ribonuclease LE-like n=1 Tax=Magnolia sinica TaxID=86752 RepID=UPI0026581B1B|nr:extracellular ribonuclease LE-like [Magnolia sinica]